MQSYEDLIKRVKNKSNTQEEWKQLKSDILEFLEEDHPDEEKGKFVPLGYLEMVSMICDDSDG